MAETKRLKVFLSHAHSDAAAVRDLFRYLRREGVDVWLDKEKLLPGMDWNSEIRRAVRESDVVVVCLSKKFREAGYRQREVKLALDTEQEKPEGEIYIIPARLEECEVPESLRKWQWVDLFEEGGRQKLIQALRIRAGQIGASLRRRGNYGKPTPQDEADYPDDKQVSVTDLPEGKEARPGIWVDAERNVWRDSRKIGTLSNSAEYNLLAHLIHRKGEVCSYESLSHIIDPDFVPRRSLETLRQFEFKAEIFQIMKKLTSIIEEGSKLPRFLVDTGDGYKLDWKALVDRE